MVWQEALQRLVDGTAGALSLSGRTLSVRDRPRPATAIDGLAHKAGLAAAPGPGVAPWGLPGGGGAAGALFLEIARSEMGYTNQRPAEYTSSIVAAAVAEGWQGPVFLQGDHFQISAKRFAETPLKQVASV